MFEWEERLEGAITGAGAGEFGGNELAVEANDGLFYLHGPDADAIFSVARPLLEASSSLHNVQVCLRSGPPERGVRRRILDVAEPDAPRN